MRLKDYLDSLPGPQSSKRLFAEKSGLSYLVICEIYNGTRLLKHYPTAKKLSAATGGLVSIAELCEPPATPKRKRASGENGARR